MHFLVSPTQTCDPDKAMKRLKAVFLKFKGGERGKTGPLYPDDVAMEAKFEVFHQ
jgi:hypothetical protein